MAPSRASSLADSEASFFDEVPRSSPNVPPRAVRQSIREVKADSANAPSAKKKEARYVVSNKHGRWRSSQLDIRKDMFRFASLTQCSNCSAQPTFCVDCCARFAKTTPLELCKQLAFQPEAAEEFLEMFSDLSERVSNLEKQNRTSKPGGALTVEQRQSLSDAAVHGLQLQTIAQAIEREKYEHAEGANRGKPRSTIDAMPVEAIAWLASIDDDARLWLAKHDGRVRRRAQTMAASPLDAALARQDGAIDMDRIYKGAAAERKSYIPRRRCDLGKPEACKHLPPAMHALRSKIEQRALKYQKQP
ncbi:hypothetical protein M885DRAFT_505838 [Pelagophyceae sp. CCMP2097]|nr:hypothetical protein M885DRAFT_505838 [Pelagophyceae sp. CCMP2097]